MGGGGEGKVNQTCSHHLVCAYLYNKHVHTHTMCCMKSSRWELLVVVLNAGVRLDVYGYRGDSSTLLMEGVHLP